MKAAPFPSPDAWLSPSDLDADIAKRVRQMAERLAGWGSAPDHLSDDEKQTFQSAQSALASKRKADVLFNAQIWVLYTTLSVGLFIFVPLLSHAAAHGTFAEVVRLESIAGLILLAQIALALWRGRIKREITALPQTAGLALRFIIHKNPLEKVYCQAVAALLQEHAIRVGRAAGRQAFAPRFTRFVSGRQANGGETRPNRAGDEPSIARRSGRGSRAADKGSCGKRWGSPRDP